MHWSDCVSDSESEEEMSKRAAGRELMGPPPVPPKIRRGGGAYRGSGRGHPPPIFQERRHSQPMMPPGPAFRQFSHSSSDDEVFLEPLPVERCGPPPPFTRHPPPFPGDIDAIIPPPPLHRLAGDPYHEPYFQPQHRRAQTRFSEEVPCFTERPQIRERHHSMPAGGHDPSRGRDPFRGFDPPRGCDSSRGHPVHKGGHVEVPPLQSCPPFPVSGELSDEGSVHRLISGSDEFEYLRRYGYHDCREGRMSSGTSSGSVGARSRI